MPDELERILYLEDVEEIAEIGMMALEDVGGFEVHHSPTGTDAIEAFSTFKPQLCLFDIMLPDISGLDVFKAVQDMPGGKDVPVVFMTAKAQSHEQEHYMACGAAGVIVKPFNPMQLSDQVKELWSKYGEGNPDRAACA